MPQKIQLKIKRQDSANLQSYWEYFEVPFVEDMTVISALQFLQKKPINLNGTAVAPVVYQSSCEKSVCGSCVMVINGQAKQACEVFLKDLAEPVVIEPLKKFPVLRDLIIDRAVVFENLKKHHVWNDDTAFAEVGVSAKIPLSRQQKIFHLAACTNCGVCLDACPQYNDHSAYSGAALLTRLQAVNLQNKHSPDLFFRLDSLVDSEAVSGCGNAQNCVKSCPQGIELTDLIGQMKRDANKHWLKRFFGSPFSA